MTGNKYGLDSEKEDEKIFEVYKEYLSFEKDNFGDNRDIEKEGLLGIVYKNRSEEEKNPTQNQLEALDYYITNQIKLAEVLDEKLWKEWPSIVLKYDLDYDDDFPKIVDKEDLKKVYGLRIMYIYEETENKKCYCGFSGYSRFDEEHGIGFVLHELEVIDFGGSDISFESHKVLPFKYE